MAISPARPGCGPGRAARYRGNRCRRQAEAQDPDAHAVHDLVAAQSDGEETVQQTAIRPPMAMAARQPST